jgi:thioredoxin reductase
MRERLRAKLAPRATRSSDVTRARTLALAALGAAVGAGTALAAGTTPTGAEPPLARPHAVAKIACAKCHEASSGEAVAAPGPASSGAAAVRLPPRAASSSATSGRPPSGAAIATTPSNTFTSSGACRSCHDKSPHASARAAHRALAVRGELACATCHPAHDGAQGITFSEGGRFVRWGAGAEFEGSARVGAGTVKAGTTVPLVALSACARCHDATSPRDPIAACVPAEVRARASASVRSGVDASVDAAALLARTPSLCFDEHRSVATADARLVAWEAAREASARTSWTVAPRRGGSPWAPLGAGLVGALAFGGVAVLARRRESAKAAPVAACPPAPAVRKRLPVIDTGTCLGCYACVDVCPFDVFVIERYVAVVARPEECCGVVLCAQVCPNGSLTVSEGEAVLDRPAVDEHLESRDVPGLFLAGDLTGLPLIKNAINQGVRAIDRVAATLPRRRSAEIDVIVIGAGPAGLAAALRAKERGLSCVVLEQATVAASIKSFPREKIVYDPPLDLPVEGELWLKEATKEELVAQWTRIVRSRAIDVREDHRVTAIERDRPGADDATFVVTTTEDASGARGTFRASRVVVAIGRRGTPRLLDLAIDPGAEGHVSYALADARSFAGKRVVVAGLGDSAMEAAIALARQPETSVTIVYRGAAFARGKARNIAEVRELIAKGRLRLLFETIPVAVSRTAVTVAGVTAGKGRRTLQADVLLVLVGGVPSWDLLVRAGVRRPAAPDSAPPTSPHLAGALPVPEKPA